MACSQIHLFNYSYTHHPTPREADFRTIISPQNKIKKHTTCNITELASCVSIESGVLSLTSFVLVSVYDPTLETNFELHKYRYTLLSGNMVVQANGCQEHELRAMAELSWRRTRRAYMVVKYSVHLE